MMCNLDVSIQDKVFEEGNLIMHFDGVLFTHLLAASHVGVSVISTYPYFLWQRHFHHLVHESFLRNSSEMCVPETWEKGANTNN